MSVQDHNAIDSIEYADWLRSNREVLSARMQRTRVPQNWQSMWLREEFLAQRPLNRSPQPAPTLPPRASAHAELPNRHSVREPAGPFSMLFRGRP